MAGVRELGAEILGESMVIGELAYEVVFGWLGALEAASESDETLAAGAKQNQTSDADLLARFMLSALNDSPKR